MDGSQLQNPNPVVYEVQEVSRTDRSRQNESSNENDRDEIDNLEVFGMKKNCKAK